MIDQVPRYTDGLCDGLVSRSTSWHGSPGAPVPALCMGAMTAPLEHGSIVTRIGKRSCHHPFKQCNGDRHCIVLSRQPPLDPRDPRRRSADLPGKLGGRGSQFSVCHGEKQVNHAERPKFIVAKFAPFRERFRRA
jgi:hypothetical protein